MSKYNQVVSYPRIISRKSDPNIRYYNPYNRHNRKAIIERRPFSIFDEPQQFWFESGWFSQKHYALKMKKKPKLKYPYKEGSADEINRVIGSFLEPVISQGETYWSDFECGPLFHAITDEGSYFCCNGGNLCRAWTANNFLP